MNKPILRVENLKKCYNGKLALEIPHLEFEAGGIYALVGPNGAGKTTLLKLLNLLIPPDEGKIYFDGYEINRSSSNALKVRRQMTLVMQDPILFRTNVYRNVAYGLSVRLYNEKAMAAAVSDALSMVGLAGFEDRKVRQLSAGEAQRVALARALILEPRVLFLDEPTANVDRRNIQMFESLIKKINAERGTTIILTTHDLSQAYRLTDKIIPLLDGRIVGGSLENVFYGRIEEPGVMSISPSIRIAVPNHRPDLTGIYIDPGDIVIMADPIRSDLWNCLKGRIISVTFENSTVRLTLDAGVELVALATRNDFQRMGLDVLNRTVYASFKVADVHVF